MLFTGADEDRKTLSRRMCQRRNNRPRSPFGFGRRRLSRDNQLFCISEKRRRINQRWLVFLCNTYCIMFE